MQYLFKLLILGALFPIMLALSTPAFAREKDPLKSIDYREDVDWTVYAHPIVITSDGVGLGVGVGRQLMPDAWLEGIALTTTTGGSERMDMFQLRMKWFLGNSFFFHTGVAARDQFKLAESADPEDADGYDDGKRVWSSGTVGMVCGLGNQWQFKSFTIGGEWGAVYRPLSKVASKGDDIHYSYAYGSYSASKRATLLFLGLSLGASL